MTSSLDLAGTAGVGSTLPPLLDGRLPGLGHALELRRRPVDLVLRGFRAHGEIFRITALGRSFAVLVGPEAHDAYFRAPDDVLSQKEVYQFTVPIFGPGIAYDTTPELMAEQVGFLYPAVRDGRMQTYADRMHAELDGYLATWGEEGEIDLRAALNEITTKIACRCLLGEEVRNLLYDGFDRLYHHLQGGINMVGFYFPHLPTPAHRRRDAARRAVGEMLGGIIAARRRDGSRAEDFMQTLMEARYADGRPVTDAEVAGILITALFAGQHSSSVLGTWSGIEFCRAPEYAGRIRAELAEIYRGGRAISLASLREQKVLDRGVREAERLHPPLIILVRKVLKDFAYKGRTVPAGALAMVSPAASHRLPHVFRDPDRYDPDRYVQPNGEDRIAPHTLITFGGGRHVCIGMHFAYMQIKLIWSVLLNRYDFALAGPEPATDYAAWVAGPKGGSRVRYRRRRSEVAL